MGSATNHNSHYTIGLTTGCAELFFPRAELVAAEQQGRAAEEALSARRCLDKDADGCDLGLKHLNQTGIPLQAAKSSCESGPSPFHVCLIPCKV